MTKPKPERNKEVTSKRVAAIAGKVLRCLTDRHGSWPVFWGRDDGSLNPPKDWVSVAELRSLAGSALTQSPNRTPYGADIEKRMGKPVKRKK